MGKSSNAFNIFREILRRYRGFRGFLSSKRLAKITGAVEDPQDSADHVVFTAKEMRDNTIRCSTDKDIVQGYNSAKEILKKYSKRPHEVLPDIFVGDEKHEALIQDLYEKLTERVKPSDTKDGICDDRAVPGGWESLFAIPGEPMNPMGYPICDNSAISGHEGPVNADHEKIMRNVIRIMFGTKWKPESGYEVATKSSTGFPFHEYDIDFKMKGIDKILANMGLFLDLVSSQDLRGLARTFGVVLTYSISRRNQRDSVKLDDQGNRTSKVRSAPSVGQAAGYEKGTLFADKEDKKRKGWFKQRSRPVYAANAFLNYLLSMIFSPFRDWYLSAFPFLWKTTSAENLRKKLQGWKVLGVDATQFDQRYPTWFANMIFDELEKSVDHRLVTLMRWAWKMPAFCPSPVEGEDDQAAWFGDPMDLKTFRATRGLPSGIAYNPDFGKAWGVVYVLCLFHDAFGGVVDNEEVIMKGEHSAFATVNQGDDALLCVKSQVMYDQLKALLLSGEASPYIQLELETPVTFLGWVITWNGSEYAVYPNIQSMVLNFFCNEHPIGDPKAEIGHRKHWALGIEAWESVFKVCPEYEVVRSTVEEVVRAHCGQTLTSLSQPYLIMSKKVLGTGAVNEDEARFLEKPERRFYSVEMNRVRKEIREEYVRTIPPEEIERRLRPYIKLAS